MRYMPGEKQITRVHGPFVSDDEVLAVADHWRAQGQPDYIQAVTEEPEDGSFALDGADLSDDSPDAQLYRKACQLVFDNQKASTSWLRSEEHTSELQSLMRISYAVFCLKKKNTHSIYHINIHTPTQIQQ